MCDATMAFAGMSMAGAGMSMASSQARANAIRANAKLNANSLDDAIKEAFHRGTTRELQVLQQGSAVETAETIRQTGSGAVTGTGGAAAAERTTEANLQVARTTVRRNAYLEALGLGQQKRAVLTSADNEARAAEMEGWGTFLGGMGRFAASGWKIGGDQTGGGGGGDGGWAIGEQRGAV